MWNSRLVFFFQHWKYFTPLSPCFHGLWREVWYNSYPSFSIGEVVLITPLPLPWLLSGFFSFVFDVLQFGQNVHKCSFFGGFPNSSVGKESTCNAGDPGSIYGSGRSAGEGIDYPLQYSWVSLVAQLVKNLPAMRETGFDPWVGKIPWRRDRLPTPVHFLLFILLVFFFFFFFFHLFLLVGG